MSAKTFNTRFQLKYDTYENWSDKDKQFKLLQGEIAIVYIPETTGVDGVLHEPAVLFKVGDGTNTFNQLPFVSALAGDVPTWAKATTFNNQKISDTAFTDVLTDLESIKAFFKEGEGNVDFSFSSILERLGTLESNTTTLSDDLGDVKEQLASQEEEIKTTKQECSDMKDEITLGVQTFIDNDFTPVKEKLEFFLESEEIDTTVNTLHEIRDWMSTSGTEVTNLTTAIATEKTEREKAISDLNDSLTESIEGVAEGVEIALGDLQTAVNEYTDEKIAELESSLVVDIDDLNQREEYIIFNCGNATTLVSNPEDVNVPSVTTE